MNKVFSKVFIVIICLSLVLSGCTASSQPGDTASNNAINEDQEGKDANKEVERTKKRADMFGRVKSIIGNEVVLEIAEMPQITDDKQNNQKNQAVGVPTGQGNGTGQKPQGVGRRELKFTGETATLLIPVGIPITTRLQGESKEIDLADIYEGVSLQIWFDDIDKEDRMITRVVMMQGRE